MNYTKPWLEVQGVHKKLNVAKKDIVLSKSYQLES